MATINAIDTPKISLANTLTTSGNFALTLTTTNTTSVTLPTSGTLATLSGSVLTSLEVTTYKETLTVANTGSAYTIDLSVTNSFELTLTANCTFTISNPPASGKLGSITLFLKQDATGSRTVTWPASVIWPGGTAPTLTTTASHVDVIVLTTTDGGTHYRAATSALNYSA
jgi:hypothetical protein